MLAQAFFAIYEPITINCHYASSSRAIQAGVTAKSRLQTDYGHLQAVLSQLELKIQYDG